ncbi:1867_t:CDS:1, partial [Scutellospora calospora]
MEIEETHEDLQLVPSSTTNLSSGSTSQTSYLRKRPTHKPTSAEEEILKQLEEYKDSTVLPAEVLNELVQSLSKHTDYWTRKRIWDR